MGLTWASVIAVKQQLKNNIILFSVIGSYIAMAVLEIVYTHTFRMLIVLGFLMALAVLGFLLSRWARDFKKIVDSLPADHKLVTQHIAAIDIGNFRFIYRVYEKGLGMNPVSKSYISMEVGIPFPEEEKKGSSVRESIRSELGTLMDKLREDGFLSAFNPIVQDHEGMEDAIQTIWLGQPFRLEFPLKLMTPSKMVAIQDEIIGIIDKYRLQDLSWCLIGGGKYGTEYRYHKGNLLQHTVLAKDTFDCRRADYQEIAPLWTSEYEHPFGVDAFWELYQMASRDLGKEGLDRVAVKKLTKQLFKGKKGRIARIAESAEDLSVTVTIPRQGAASTYHLIPARDRWWVFAEGRLECIDPISTDDESSACDLFLRTLLRMAESA